MQYCPLIFWSHRKTPQTPKKGEKESERENKVKYLVNVEYALVRIFRTLRLITQDLEKLRNIKSLYIKQRYGFDEVVGDDACYLDNKENSDFVSLDNIIPSEENINRPFMCKINSPCTYIDLDEPLKFNDYVDIMEREKTIVHAYLILWSKEEVIDDTISYCSLDLPKKKDEEGCDFFQRLVDYEKKSFFLSHVEIPHDCRKVFL